MVCNSTSFSRSFLHDRTSTTAEDADGRDKAGKFDSGANEINAFEPLQGEGFKRELSVLT